MTREAQTAAGNDLALRGMEQFALEYPDAFVASVSIGQPPVAQLPSLQEPFHERELEANLLHQLERFLLELGQGFAFVGRQEKSRLRRNDQRRAARNE